MDPDEIGGSCPRCDAEFRPGFTECPDCGIPLLGVDEERPTPEPPAPPLAVGALTVDPSWSGRLTLVGAACTAAVLLAVAGAAVAAIGFNPSPGFQIRDALWHQRIQFVTRSASPGLAVVALVAGLAVALGRRLRAHTPLDAVVQRTTFGAATLLLALAVVGLVDDWRWSLGNASWAQRTWSSSTWLSTAVVAATAAAVTEVVTRRRRAEEAT
ncbi:MAG: hypothetical protein JWN29_4031 [Acidimicrobiales bacterium]|nr:hypothetical protein [Acidimicrobiales bacterium]